MRKCTYWLDLHFLKEMPAHAAGVPNKVRDQDSRGETSRDGGLVAGKLGLKWSSWRLTRDESL